MHLINPNQANQEILETLPGVGRVLAERIIASRPFENLAEIQVVKGIGREKAEQLAPFLTFTFPSEEIPPPRLLTFPSTPIPPFRYRTFDFRKRLVLFLAIVFILGWVFGRLNSRN
jgi:hypothetical protein